MNPDDAPVRIESVALARLDRSHPLRAPNLAHVGALARVLDDCPPVLVQSGTLRVVDGHMRIAAAELLGRTHLPVQWVRGDEAELIALAAETNSRHGLPLTTAQRTAAVHSLLDVAPGWSNRRIARACGTCEATVRRMRRPGASSAPLDRRIGVDGKTYPVGAVARETARDLLAAGPERSDRAIARATGLSPTTVGHLRRDEPAEPPTAHQRRVRPWRAALRWLLGLLGVRGAGVCRKYVKTTPDAGPRGPRSSP